MMALTCVEPLCLGTDSELSSNCQGTSRSSLVAWDLRKLEIIVQTLVVESDVNSFSFSREKSS